MNPASLSLSVSSRFGPTVPVAFAALRVWQAPQPDDVKTVLPAAAAPARAPLGVVGVVVVDEDGSLSAAFDSPANFSTAASWAIVSSATTPRKRPSRLPGKLGFQRGNRNDDASAKAMKMRATTPRPISCPVESASSTGAEPTRAVGPVASGRCLLYDSISSRQSGGRTT